MCIVLFQWQPKTEMPLIVAANRDEFLARPAEAARWRDDVFCGLDLRAGGTWIGITRNGRFAAITNFREPIQDPNPGTRSRGELPWNFLHSTSSPAQYAAEVETQKAYYGPFNLLVGDKGSLWYLSNRGTEPRAVNPGIHGLSNGLLDTPWPKVERGKRLFEKALMAGAHEQKLLTVLTDRAQPDASELPETGVPDALEKLVAPIFIESPQYGTRCSTLIWLSTSAIPRVVERRWQD